VMNLVIFVRLIFSPLLRLALLPLIVGSVRNQSAQTAVIATLSPRESRFFFATNVQSD